MDLQNCPEFRRLRRGLSRRSVLQWGALGAAAQVVGRTHAQVASANPATSGEWADALGFGKAKACILMFMWGGPSHLDTWDLKPAAPAEVRGEFSPIATTVPGLTVSEHFPRLARHAEHLAVIRSVTHDDPAHLSSVHHLLTGRHAPQVKSDAVPPSRKDSPHIGSALARLRDSQRLLPPFVMMPWAVNHPAAPGGTAPGQNAGWFGAAHDPFLVSGDPNHPAWRVSGLGSIDGVDSARLAGREALLESLDRVDAGTGGLGAFAGMQSRAFEMLSSSAVHQAFNLNAEAPAVRERYGRHIHGQCLLLARRLVEAGVTFICVNWHQDGQNFWDTHGDNFRRLKQDLMPPSDRAFAALLDDLADRQLLDDTLLVWCGEFGRRPQITPGNAGREHWPWCGSAVLAGGGVQGGQVYGRSDAQGAYPAEDPVSPADIAATMYHALGVQSDLELLDTQGRPQKLTEGRPLFPLF